MLVSITSLHGKITEQTLLEDMLNHIQEMEMITTQFHKGQCIIKEY